MQHVQVSYCLPQHPSYSKFGSARIMTNELRLATVMARTLQNNNVGIKMEKSEGKRIVWNNYNKYKIKYIRLNTHTHTEWNMANVLWSCVYALMRVCMQCQIARHIAIIILRTLCSFALTHTRKKKQQNDCVY